MNAMTLNFLFYLGIIIPTVITFVLFIIFVMCLRKFKARDKIVKDKYDPHGRNFKIYGQRVVVPPPPRWGWIEIKSGGKQNDAYVTSATTTPAEELQPHDSLFGAMQRDHRNDCVYGARQHEPHNDSIFSALQRDDSGVSEMNDMQMHADRPYSQASSDSDDSGFRSSRSVPYLQNANQEVPLIKPTSLTDEKLSSPARDLSVFNHRSQKYQLKTPEKHSPMLEITTVSDSAEFMCTCLKSRTDNINDFHNKLSPMALNHLSHGNTSLNFPTDNYETIETVTTATIHLPTHNHIAPSLAYSVV